MCSRAMTGLAGLMLVLLVATVRANYYDDDYLVQDLYKRLSQLDDYLADENEPYGGNSDWLNDRIPLDSRGDGATDIRDHEYLEHSSSKGGFQYISGGAGEGNQHLTPEGTQNNTHEVKSDESLPFYCHPPNPCPKGFTEGDGCQLDVKDTAEDQKKWISNMMTSGQCSCDEEHMFSCPKEMNTINADKGHEERDNLDKVLDSLLAAKMDTPYSVGNKRQNSITKKGHPGNIGNPFLDGQVIHTVAKKGGVGSVMMK